MDQESQNKMIGTTLLNRYQIDSELGRGGIGIVYKGHDLLLDRDIAIKVINTKILGSEGNTRLFQEARVIAHLNHPNIVTVYDAGEVDDITFVIMELVEGSSLHEKPPKDLEELVSIIRFVCAGLEHAHQHGIIHRDLKPENVMISPDGRVRLMDFGLARSISSRLTSEGTIIGTVFYMAPEQALGQAVDNRADLYALGVMLYELATGRLPFSGEDPLTVITQHLHTPPVPPCAINPKIPMPLESLILHLMSKRPEDRPSSASEVLHRLESIWQQPSPAPVEFPEELTLARIVRGRMVGREKELAELVDAWRCVLQGCSDERVLLVSGEPGVGKTRLVRELMTRAAVEKAVVLMGECYAEEGALYAPLAQVVRQALLHPTLASKNPLDDQVLADLITLAPDLQAHFPEVAPNPRLDPRDEQQRLYDSVLEMMIRLSQSAPIMLVIDDAHWADRATLFLLRYLARRSKMIKLPLLMVATYREVELDEARPWHEVLSDLNRERLSIRLKLSRLDKEQTRDMLAILFDEEITPELLEAVFYETEGNPFFVEEVVKTLIDEGKFYYKNGRWHRPSMKEIVIPQSVRIAIQTRLTALPADVQEMLRMASVLGREFDDLLIRQSLEFDEETLISTLENAEKAQLIRETEARQPGLVKYTFVHALIHATIYESVSGLRRQRLHRRAAKEIEAIRPTDFEALAVHYQEGGDLERARKNAMKAGERALALYANQDAEQYFKTTLELDGPEDEKVIALSGLGRALFRESRFKESIDIWKQAIPIYHQLREFDKVARTYAWLAEAARQIGDIEAGIAFGEEGLALLADQPATAGKVALMRETGNSLTMRGWKDKAVALFRQALDEANKIGDIEEQAETLIRLSFDLYFSNQPDRLEGLQMLQRALKLAESSGLLMTAEMAHTYLAEICYDAGNMQAALTHIEKAIQLSRQMGLANRELFDLNWMCYFQFVQGNIMAFEHLSERSRYLSKLTDSSGSAVLGFHMIEAVLCYGRREIARGLEILRDAYEQARQAQNINFLVLSAQYLVECLIEEGKWKEAEQVLQGTLQIVEQEGVFIIYCFLARNYSQQNKLDDARTILEKARIAAGPSISYWDQFYLSFAEAVLACKEQRWDEGWKHFDNAYELAAQCGARWYEAQILRNRVEVLLERGESGDQSRSCELLEKILALYQTMQLPAWAKLIENRLEEVRENLNAR
jgi:tetratricopeptide (TPR) repeat protein